MKKRINGIVIECTSEEVAARLVEAEVAERDYWLNIPYDEAVDTKIRERYTASQEFAVLRQKDEKPDEYRDYYAYCEECKAYVKEMKAKYE